MNKFKIVSSFIIFSACTAVLPNTVFAQGVPLPVELLPLGKDIGIAEGQTVTPAYEGWYEDDNGNIALSFGYYNRNTEEVLDVPIGPNNRIIGAPKDQDNQGQPTQFQTGRQWGAFTVAIPADYKKDVAWHLVNQGRTFHIRANRDPAYIIDAIAGDANGNFPPQISFSATGQSGHGPEGIVSKAYQAKVGKPITIDVWAKDDGIGSGLLGSFMASAGDVPPLSLAWSKQQGPGMVSFKEAMSSVPVDGGKASNQVTFAKAGDYTLRVLVNEFTGMETAGHSQCCWTNGFIKVNVTN